MVETDKCIYCNSSSDLCRHAHAVPRALGTFENQPSLKKHICRQCDSEIGKCEEQLIKCGPEAFIRIALGITGRSGSDSTSPFKRRHAGQEPLKFKTKYPDTNYDVLVELIPGTQNARPLPQVVIVAPDGSCEQVLVTDEAVTSEELDRRIRATQLKGRLVLWPIASTEQEQDRIMSLLRQSKYFSGEEVNENIRACNESVEVVGTIVVDKRYFRAIAKIAFHYFLIYYDGFYGSEKTFEAIRRFIRYGDGEIAPFVRQQRGNLVSDLDKGYRPKYYGHLLIGNVSNRTISVNVQLFIGRDIDPPHYSVFIGRNPRNVWMPPERFGHFYSYLEPNTRQNYHGIIQKLGANMYIVLPKQPYM